MKRLIVMLNYGRKQVRCEAAKHIELLVANDVPSGRQALPALLVALEDQCWAVREKAVLSRTSDNEEAIWEVFNWKLLQRCGRRSGS